MQGRRLRMTLFGQSHSPAMGVTLDGLPAGFRIDFDALRAFMTRRMPSGAAYSTKRREPDETEFLSGLVDGVTCGAPLTILIRNQDARSADYAAQWDIPRPAHADYTAYVKHGAARDVRGGGAFSGRLTAPLCAAGGVCLQLLRREGIDIAAHIAEIGGIADLPFDPAYEGGDDFQKLRANTFPVLNAAAGEQMLAAVAQAREAGDSLGGVVECAARGVPAGLGDPPYEGMENRLSVLLFSIPAVKGVEFGSGFASARQTGSAHNDAFYTDGEAVKTKTNRHGGILGGITSGMPVIFRTAFKPTPSISKEQESVSLSRKENLRFTIAGRHDACIVPRAVPCVEAAAAVAVYDAWLNR